MKKVRAEIPNREWLEFEVTFNTNGQIAKVTWRAKGCHNLLEACAKAAQVLQGKALSEVSWPGIEHWNLLISEAFDKLQDKFEIPYREAELCHCRKIPTQRVDESIVLGAHTPEKVRAWTQASSGCGTCRPEVEKLIGFRLKKAT